MVIVSKFSLWPFFLHSVTLFIVTLMTSTWSFEVNERTQEILSWSPISSTKMCVFKKECHPWKYGTRIVLPNLRDVAGRAIYSIRLFSGIPWLSSLTCLILSHSCPICLEDSEKAALETTSLLSRTNHWFNGRLKRFNPQIVFHTNTCMLHVSCMYLCCKGHEISSCHSSVLSSFPVSHTFQLPFCSFHKSGFTKDALLLVQKLVDEGLNDLLNRNIVIVFHPWNVNWCDYRLENHQGDQDIMKELRFFLLFQITIFLIHPMTY